MLLLLLFVVEIKSVAGISYHEPLTGHQVWEVTGLNQQVANLLKKSEEEGQIDILRTAEDHASFRVFPEYVDHMGSLMTEGNIIYDIVTPDLRRFLEIQDELQSKRRRAVELECSRDSCVKPLSDAYMSFNEIENYLFNINDSRASVESIGTTEEGRDIWLVKIAPREESSFKQPSGFFIEGGIHAREWISPAVTLHIIHYLLENPQTGDGISFNIVPMANPDGYEYSQRTNRMWRKNRSTKMSSSCPGIDLNRNWGYKFGIGASSFYCSEVYKGATPFSEPETKAIRKAIVGTPNIKFVLAVHSYGQMLIYPWGWTTSVAPNTWALKRMGARISNAIYKKSNFRYEVANSASRLGLASGATDDWAKGVLGVKYSYTLELRDRGNKGFILPSSQITPTSEEVWAGLKAALNGIRAESV